MKLFSVMDQELRNLRMAGTEARPTIFNKIIWGLGGGGKGLRPMAISPNHSTHSFSRAALASAMIFSARWGGTSS